MKPPANKFSDGTRYSLPGIYLDDDRSLVWSQFGDPTPEDISAAYDTGTFIVFDNRAHWDEFRAWAKAGGRA
jgi:hypothetical protein